ncbi:nociceptin receptor-like [Acanthaster planci]|uniref:Nociceptin receptor-like n=1 Tax=Acanthaster planci TaxID=133434 RepID=A0A8B7ZSM9_ACAPL|nr:nociceptin receptor-like [Acanthaster planci]
MFGDLDIFEAFVYGNASMTTYQLDLIMCTMLTCLVQNQSAECGANAYVLSNDPSLLLIQSNDDQATISSDAAVHAAAGGSTEMKYFHHSQFVAHITEEDVRLLEYSTIDIVVFKYMVPFIKAFGLLANLAYFFTLFRVRDLRNTANFYLANLAVADTIILINGFVPDQHEIIHTRYRSDYGNFSDAYFSFFLVSVMVLDMSLDLGKSFCTLITVERYIAICHPFKYNQIQTKKRAVMLATVAWLIPIAFGIATLVQRQSTWIYVCQIGPIGDQYDSLTGLLKNRKLQQLPLAYELVLVSVLCLVLLVNFVLYVLIIKAIRKPSPVTSETAQVSRRQKQVTLTLVVNGIFFGCYLPTAIDLVLFVVQRTHPDFMTGEVWINYADTASCAIALLILINSSINPIIFNVGSERFRKAFLEAFCCKKRPRPGNNIPLRIIRQNNAQQ